MGGGGNLLDRAEPAHPRRHLLHPTLQKNWRQREIWSECFLLPGADDARWQLQPSTYYTSRHFLQADWARLWEISFDGEPGASQYHHIFYVNLCCLQPSRSISLRNSQQLSPLPNPRSLYLPATSTPGVLLAGSLAWLPASAFAQVLLLFCPCAFALTFSFYLHLKTLHVTWASWTRREISSQK